MKTAFRITTVYASGTTHRALADNEAWAEQYAADLREWSSVETSTVDIVPVVVADLPARFYDDHVDRDLPAGCFIKRLAKRVRVALDREAFDDLHSDADYYTDPATVGQLGPEYAGLVASARATLRALETLERPERPDRIRGPLSDAHVERLVDLAASAPLVRRAIDDDLDALGWTERWDDDEGTTALREGRVERLYDPAGRVRAFDAEGREVGYHFAVAGRS